MNLEPLTVPRHWGDLTYLRILPNLTVCELRVLVDKSMPMVYHNKHGSHWTVVEGSALTSIQGKVQVFNKGESFHIPIGHIYRIYNNGPKTLVLIDVQYGSCDPKDVHGV